ncbi:MAG TPA: hypothetical protein VGE52_01460, partial [Pirellulales bacterium]
MNAPGDPPWGVRLDAREETGAATTNDVERISANASCGAVLAVETLVSRSFTMNDAFKNRPLGDSTLAIHAGEDRQKPGDS